MRLNCWLLSAGRTQTTSTCPRLLRLLFVLEVQYPCAQVGRRLMPHMHAKKKQKKNAKIFGKQKRKQQSLSESLCRTRWDLLYPYSLTHEAWRCAVCTLLGASSHNYGSGRHFKRNDAPRPGRDPLDVSEPNLTGPGRLTNGYLEVGST